VGGFDEQTFSVAYNDVDYCYRLVDAGYRCVYAPGAKLLHLEGYSRGFNDRPQEVAAFRAKYRERNDPYYSPHLSAENEQFSISSRRLPCLSSPRPPTRALMCAFTLNLEGAPHSQFELTLALKQAGVIDPIVFAPMEGPLRAEYEQNGIPVHVFEHPLRGADTLPQYEEAIAKFSNWVKAQGAEVLYANTMESFYAIAAARHANVPSIWNIRESEPWQTYYRHLSPEIANRALDCFAYPYRVIFVAHATRDRYAALASRHQFTVIHNGLNLERLTAAAQRWPRSQARAQLGLAEDETMLLLLGTVCERKGQMDLVEALALLDARQIARCRCFIVGDRPSSYSTRLNRRVRELVQQRGLRVTIVAETHDTALYYSAADIFICTSRVESYPRVILEAMAYGLPIVTTPVFGVREQVKPEVNGLFYEPGDIAGLRAALDRLMTDGKLRREFAENAEAVLATLTSFEEMIARYGRIFIEAAECQATPLATDTVRLTADAPQIFEKTTSEIVARPSMSSQGVDSLQNSGD
jgi:glycosyltransferase involved in cell wall biosynthesis